MQLALVDWIIIIVYFAFNLAIGFYYRKKATGSVSDYFVSGRNVTWWLAGTSMVATTFAADTPLAVTGLTARNGIAGNWIWWSMVFSGMLTVFFYAKLWRRAGVLTDVEFAEIRYSGKPAAFLRGFRALYLGLPINLIVMGWVNLAMIKILTLILDIDKIYAVYICIGIMVLTASISTLSGLWGVLVMDLFQFVLKMGMVIALAVFAVDAIGGMSSLKEGLVQLDQARNAGSASTGSVSSFTPDLNSLWMPMITFFVYIAVNWWATWYPGSEPGGGGFVAQRIFSAKNEKHSILATLWFNTRLGIVGPIVIDAERKGRDMKFQTIENIIKKHGPAIDRERVITPAEYQERWRKVQAAMNNKGYDLAYACGSELDRSDVAWLAGIFDPIIERYGILVPAAGKPVVVAGSEGGHVLEDSVHASGADIALLREYQISDEDYRFAKFEKLEDVVYRLVPYRPGKQIKVAIFSSSQFIPHDHVGLFKGRFGSENVTFDVELLRKIKYEKSPTEFAIIGMANAIADAAFLGMLSAVEPGMRELDVAGVGDYIMKKLGAGRTGFPTIVSSGTRGRTVLGPATNRPLQKGEFVSMGISPTFNGYHGIMRRTVKVGEGWTNEEKAFMDALEGLYHSVMKATIVAAQQNSPTNFIDREGKEYLEKTRVKDKYGRMISPREPYTFIHNTGCSECQEGFGAITPYTTEPLGENVALMIDVAFMGVDEKKELVLPIEYAVIEDGFWRMGKGVGVYNRMPLNVRSLVAGDHTDIPDTIVNPYYKNISLSS